MCKTTRGTQAASLKPVYDVPANASPSQVSAPPVAPNAFRGARERVPQIVYIADFRNDGFLGSAVEFYEFFGLTVKKVKSIHAMLVDLGKQPGVFERITLVSHANPHGMLLPMFTGATIGTNNEFFKELGKSDLAGLLSISPFSAVTKHLFTWKDKIDRAMKAARTADATSKALVPFGLDKADATPATGDLLEFVFHCFDHVFVSEADRVELNAQDVFINADQRTILTRFVEEIIAQLATRLTGARVSGTTITAEHLLRLKALLVGLKLDDLGVPVFSRFRLNLPAGSLNGFPTLKVIVPAIRNGFRRELDAARERIDATTQLDVRGCRVGEKEFVEAMREFFGRPGKLPTVTAPRPFQSYMPVAWDRLENRSQVKTFFSRTQREHSKEKLRERSTQWAELIRVKPLHTDFWTALFAGAAARFAALTWRAEVPPLFVPAPGLESLDPLDLSAVITQLKDYFDVPPADVPKKPQLDNMKALAQALPGYAPALLAPVPDNAGATALKTLLERLKTINDEQGLTVVPATSTAVPTVKMVRDLRQGILDAFDTGVLAPLKTFMRAAATSLNEGDGLHYYMLHAGVPVFVFGGDRLNQYALFLLRRHQKVVQQSWYRCLWADALPEKGKHTTAQFKIQRDTATNIDISRVVPVLVGDNRADLVTACPLPHYARCITKRPLLAHEADGDCNEPNP